MDPELALNSSNEPELQALTRCADHSSGLAPLAGRLSQFAEV